MTLRFKCKDLGELNKVLNMRILRTADGGLFVLQASNMRDVLVRIKEHVPANVNSVELPADPKIRLNACGATKVKGYHADTTGLREIANEEKDFRGNMPYTELLGALLWL